MSMSACEICGNYAYYTAMNLEVGVRRFCGNHTRTIGDSLIKEGYVIDPPNYKEFEAENIEAVKNKESERVELLKDYTPKPMDAIAPEDGIEYISRLLVETPEECIRDVIIPAAVSATQYKGKIRVFIRNSFMNEQVGLSIFVEPAQQIETTQEWDDFNTFARVFFSVFDTIVTNIEKQDE